jgi:hypothetical protein
MTALIRPHKIDQKSKFSIRFWHHPLITLRSEGVGGGQSSA